MHYILLNSSVLQMEQGCLLHCLISRSLIIVESTYLLMQLIINYLHICKLQVITKNIERQELYYNIFIGSSLGFQIVEKYNNLYVFFICGGQVPPGKIFFFLLNTKLFFFPMKVTLLKGKDVVDPPESTNNPLVLPSNPQTTTLILKASFLGYFFTLLQQEGLFDFKTTENDVRNMLGITKRKCIT